MKSRALLLLLNFAVGCGLAFSADRPNIVFILVDDLGWSDLHCYGHAYHQTPNIDRLASQGMRFTNAYSPAPICSAARASMLTGKAVPRLGFEFVTKDQPGRQRLDADVPMETPPLTLNLPLQEKTIAEVLNPLGYLTAFFGKWHVSQHYQKRYLAWHPKFGPQAQGFEVADEDFGDHPYAWNKKSPPSPAPNAVIPADSMVRRVTDFIATKHDHPYFVMASSFYVHTPVKNRCRWLVEDYGGKVPMDSPNRRQRIEYAAFLETMDHHVGTILASIEASQPKENTLVVLMSDNGGHPEFCGNAPLRGSKWNLYEGGIRVPFIASWPGRIEAGSVCDKPVIGYDLLPTFVDVAGGTAKECDGKSLVQTFEGEDISERTLVWHFPYYHPESTFSKSIDDIGVNDFAVSKTRPQSAVRRGAYKLIKFAEDDRVELYDIGKDVSEQNDLSKQLPGLTKELNDLLEQNLSEMSARQATRKRND